MQLISLLLFLFSVVALGGATLFLVLWHRSCRKTEIVQMLREDIGHVGVSAIVEYPETPAPLVALLEEEYTRSEAVVITDLQHRLSPFGELIGQYHLIKVNHTHLPGVRALYRSRHRAYRRVVMVDLPVEYSEQATSIGKKVASYDYLLLLKGESVVEPEAITYCANLIALQSPSNVISLQSVVGCGARLEKSGFESSERVVRLRTNRALAWRNRTLVFALSAMLLPMIMIFVAYISGSRLLFYSAVTVVVAVGVFLYVSCRVVTDKNLFIRFDTILRNFYRFLVERIKNFHYLYKRRWRSDKPLAERIPIFNRKRTNRESL